MTDNSAEREAEAILKAEARRIQTEQCPQGEECAVHHRVDEEYIQEDLQYVRFITYTGDYVVLTEDNHVYGTPSFLLKLVLGKVTRDELPPRWETSIFRVGDGAIGDLADLPDEERGEALRYAKTHDVWESLQEEHSTTVWALIEGLIDVSKPLAQED